MTGLVLAAPFTVLTALVVVVGVPLGLWIRLEERRQERELRRVDPPATSVPDD